MAQVALQFTAADLATVDRSLREAHARFLSEHRDALVTFGPFRSIDGVSAGYAYQTDFPGTTIETIVRFLADDPFAKAGLYHASAMSGWRCALKIRQPAVPVRPGLQGFFFYGIGKPNITARRNEILEPHRAHLMQVDETNCLSRGPLTNREGQEWMGSAMVYEFADRRTLDEFFRTEPYCVNGIYERVEIYDWQRGEMAA